MTIFQAFLISIAYFLANSTLIGVGFFTLYRPLVMGFVVGLILGNPVLGTQIGASINILYIGHISAGGTLPSDATSAAVIGTTLGIVHGLETEAALAVAVPVGILGAFLWFGRLTFTTMFVPLADRYAENGQASKIWIANVLLPQAFLYLLSGVPMFLITYFGVDYIQAFLNLLGQHVLGVLIVVGGLLPALGLGLTLKSIYKGPAKVFFFVGFLLIQYFNLDIISLGFLSVVITIIYVQLSDKDEKPSVQAQEAVENLPEKSGLITNRDLVRSSLIWGFHAQGAYNYERMQGIGFMHAMVPAFKKLYKEGSPEMAAALQRHSGFFNTSNQFGAMIPGLALAMEEQLYLGVEGIDDASINAIKSGLMGPISGIGDTLVQGVILPLLLSFFIGMSSDGNILGPILYSIIITIVILGMNHINFMMGYHKGSDAILNILESGAINKVIDGAKILGGIVIGGLVASYVSVNLGITIGGGEDAFSLQADLLDVILPGMLPLLLTLGAYKLIDKGWNTTKVMFALIALGIIGGLVGILV